MVVAATNSIERLDSASTRPGRLDKKIFIGPPDSEARLELLRLFLADRPQGHIDWFSRVEDLEGYTAAEIEHIVTEAARIALEQRSQISDSHIKMAIKGTPPSLPKEESRPLGFR